MSAHEVRVPVPPAPPFPLLPPFALPLLPPFALPLLPPFALPPFALPLLPPFALPAAPALPPAPPSPPLPWLCPSPPPHAATPRHVIEASVSQAIFPIPPLYAPHVLSITIVNTIRTTARTIRATIATFAQEMGLLPVTHSAF